MTQNFKMGNVVRLSEEGAENECYRAFVGKKMKIVSVSRSRDDHPGFDEGAGSALYDLVCEGKDVPFSLYDWELVSAQCK